MVKHAELLFLLDRTKPVSLQTQISSNLKRLILSGTLQPGRAVPFSRELATEARVSRNTVLQAYDRLIGEGYLEASARRGLYVSKLLEEKNLPRAESAPSLGATPPPVDSSWDRLRGAVPFRPCHPMFACFLFVYGTERAPKLFGDTAPTFSNIKRIIR